MKRTTVYFPSDMKAGIEHEAIRRGVTEAEVIRSAVLGHLGDDLETGRNFPLFEKPVGSDIAGNAEVLIAESGDS